VPGILVQCGMSSLSIAQRQDVFTEQADMISVMPTHHDEAFVEVDTHVLHPREELEDYARLARETGVKIEWEVWHTGSIWNLRYLIDRGLVSPPHITTLFFGWPGGAWTPPTVEEYLYRRRLMPPGSIVTVSVMGPEQLAIAATAIALGDHVRVGTEDFPYSHSGQPVATHELVREMATIAAAMGRPLSTPQHAKQVFGIEEARSLT
jgi:3-keto-5-aminohexanoate cleavage enzyme